MKPETPAATAPTTVGRRGFAAVAVLACGAGVAALAVPAGPVRLLLLLAFLLVGPGAAVMSFAHVRDRLVSWALAVTASLTAACGTAVTMLWTHTWQPEAAIYALIVAVAVAGVVRLVLDRSRVVQPREVLRGILSGPAAESDGRETTGTSATPAPTTPSWRRRVAAVVPIAALTGAVALWVYSLVTFNPSTVDGYGLTAAAGIPFVVAILLLGIAIATELFGRARTTVLTGGLLAVAAVLHATVPLLYGTLEYAWTYKHIGVVDLIRDNGHILSSTDIYQQWPGFFATMAMLSGVAGVDALTFATWSSLAFALLNMLLLAALLRQFNSNRRVITLGVTLFLVCMWVDSGYFSPQAFVYTLMLGFWLIVARWLVASPPALRDGAGRIARARAALLRGFPVQPARDRRTRLWAAAASTAVFAAITASHQLSPFLMLMPAVALTILGLLRPRILLVVWGLVLIAFVAPRVPAVVEQYGLFDVDVVSNAAGNADSWRTDQQRFSAVVARTLAIGVWSLALFALWRYRKRLGAVAVPAVLGFAPFVTIVAQNYGGEAIYRVFAFSLPFVALLIAGVWARLRRGVLMAVASGVVLAVMALATMQGLQGQLVVHRVPATDISAAQYFYDNARPNSSLVLLAPNFPTKLTSNYGSFNNGHPVDLALIDDPAFIQRLNGTRLPEVEGWIHNLGTRDNYLVVSTQMTVYTDYFGLLPKGATRSLEDALRASPQWQVFYQGSGTTIYRLLPID